MGDLLAALGRPLTGLVLAGLRLVALLRRTLVVLARGRFSGRHVLQQMYEVGNRSLVFVSLTLGVLGVISIYQTATQIERILPDFSMLGAAFIKIMVRQFGPSITALMIATRVGTGIAAEIGSMTVTEQIDALKMSNTDPVGYLVVPRFIACTTMVLVLAAYGVLVAVITGLLTASLGFGINPRTFLSTTIVSGSDLALGICKCISFGAAIPVISAQAGLEASGGSEGVGWATTRAVVNSSFAVVVLDFFWSVIGYVVFT